MGRRRSRTTRVGVQITIILVGDDEEGIERSHRRPERVQFMPLEGAVGRRLRPVRLANSIPP